MNEAKPVFETSPIRLSADETRLIVKAANNGGKPICDYHRGGLVEMGILQTNVVKPPDHSAEIAELWRAMRNAAKAEDVSEVRRLLGRIETLKSDKKPKEGYILTSLGKQIARGITVRLNGTIANGRC